MMPFKALVAAACLTAATTAALAIGPAPAPLAQRETLTVGFVKVGHLAPLLNIEEELKKFNVDVKRAEFVRYADARTALMSNSVDVSAVGPGDLAIAAGQGSKNLIGLTGVASSAKNLVVRKGVTINDWKDIAGKKIAIAPGSAVWFQWAMTLIEKGIPYNTFTPVNIQGGGTAFLQALKRGDIDAMVLWEPFESQAVADGDGYFAKNLEYSQSKSVGAELGMLAASREAMTNKREAIKRFMWVYLNAEEQMAKNPEMFAEAYSKYTGLPLNVTKESAKIIKLGGVLTKEQVRLQAEAAFKQGIVQKDVANEAAALYDDSMAREIKR
ncbi:MAG: ABC transporter substrate-binding protein [Burkholderiaceae bacterium]